MTLLNQYLCDGAKKQARAVLCMLQGFDIEESWNAERHAYMAEIRVARWENCREQGYVLMLRNKSFQKQLNIAFFEHRKSDSICAVKWGEMTLNSPNIDTAKMGKYVDDEWAVDHTESYGRVTEMAEWIEQTLTDFWNADSKTDHAPEPPDAGITITPGMVREVDPKEK